MEIPIPYTKPVVPYKIEILGNTALGPDCTWWAENEGMSPLGPVDTYQRFENQLVEWLGRWYQHAVRAELKKRCLELARSFPHYTDVCTCDPAPWQEGHVVAVDCHHHAENPKHIFVGLAEIDCPGESCSAAQEVRRTC